MRYAGRMPHTIELATSGRAKCRGCGEPIPKGALRLGERLPNPFAEGEMTHWFHPTCAAYKRPDPLLEALGTTELPIKSSARLERQARHSAAHRRLPRVNGAQRSPTGRARCRSCHELIEKGGWRIPLVYYEDGRFQPSGFVHAKCSAEYFGTVDLIERVRHFSPELTDHDSAEFGEAVQGK